MSQRTYPDRKLHQQGRADGNIEFAESKAAASGGQAPVYNNAPQADMGGAISGGSESSDFMNIPDSVDDEGLPFK